MTTRIRETEKYTLIKSLAGFGCCVVDNTTDFQTMFDTEIDIPKFLAATEESFNNLCAHEIQETTQDIESDTNIALQKENGEL